MDVEQHVEADAELEPSAIPFALALVGGGANALLDGVEGVIAEAGGAAAPPDEVEEALSALTSRSWCAAALGVRRRGDLPVIGAEGFAADVVERITRAARWHAWVIGPRAPRPDDVPWSSSSAERAWARWTPCPICGAGEAGADAGGPVTVAELLLGLGGVMAELRLRQWVARRPGDAAVDLVGPRAAGGAIKVVAALGRPLLARAVRCGVQAAAGGWPAGDNGQSRDVAGELAVLASSDLPTAWRSWLCAGSRTWADWAWPEPAGGCALAEGGDG